MKRQSRSFLPSVKSHLSALVPMALSFLVAIVSFAPFSFKARPQLAAIPVFFYAFRGDSRFGPVMALALGGLEDYFSGGTLGMESISFPVMYLAIRHQKFFSIGESFRLSWMAFAAAGFLLALSGYIFGVYCSPGMEPGRAFAAWLMLALAYPPFYYILDALSGKEKADA
jgi:rod shape-determining protein MreD